MSYWQITGAVILTLIVVWFLHNPAKAIAMVRGWFAKKDAPK